MLLFLIDYSTISHPSRQPWLCAINDPAEPDGSNPYIQDLARVAGELATRYSGKPGSVGHIKALEVYNEPNSSYPLWKNCKTTQVEPAHMGALLGAVTTAVRAVTPEIVILVGGLLSDHSGPEKVPATYLRAVADVAPRDAAGQLPWDGVAVHPYVDPKQLDAELTAVEKVLEDLKAPVRLWITELGYSLLNNQNTAAQQATKLEAAVLAARKHPSVERFLWFTFQDFGTNPKGDAGQMMGRCTVTPSGEIVTKRPAWNKYATLARPPESAS